MFDIYPYKAQYLTNEDVILILEGKAGESLHLRLYHLECCIREWDVQIAGEVCQENIGSFDTAFGGYGIEAVLMDGTLEASTAFDVVDNPGKSLRYGFLSDFAESDGSSHRDIETLRKYHINLLQFYDWSFRHDKLVGDSEEYHDMMGKAINKNTILNKIRTARQYGMKPMAYGAVYAASKEFWKMHRDWAFYTSAEEPFCFIDTFYIMNITRECPWHEHIIREYGRAVSEMGFAGIHMDTYGFPKTAYSIWGNRKQLISLKDHFGALIDDTKEALNRIDKDNYLVFNNVGNWPVTTVAETSQQAIYIEVWNPYDKYHHIKQIISEARQANRKNLPIILAAYLEPFRLECEERAARAAYLLMAAIVTNGAGHLLLGEENAVLTQGYYSDYTVIGKSCADKLRTYYDFMIRYMNLFYDPKLTDISMTHTGWDNYEYQCDFDNWSVSGEADKIWITLREKEDCKTICLINLCGGGNDDWNKGKEDIIPQKNLTFHVQTDAKTLSIWAASPDEDGRMEEIPYTSYKTDKGRFVSFTIPYLEIWKLIYIKQYRP